MENSSLACSSDHSHVAASAFFWYSADLSFGAGAAKRNVVEISTMPTMRQLPSNNSIFNRCRPAGRSVSEAAIIVADGQSGLAHASAGGRICLGRRIPLSPLRQQRLHHMPEVRLRARALDAERFRLMVRTSIGAE